MRCYIYLLNEGIRNRDLIVTTRRNINILLSNLEIFHILEYNHSL
jgi:hypothetical protein